MTQLFVFRLDIIFCQIQIGPIFVSEANIRYSHSRNCLFRDIGVSARRTRGITHTVHRRTTQEIPDEDCVVVRATYYLKLVEL